MRVRTMCAALFGVLAFAGPALAADTRVNGYIKKDGTYVAPHVRSAPDSSSNNNWSTQGNSNPYTGQAGTKPYNPYEPYKAPSFGTP